MFVALEDVDHRSHAPRGSAVLILTIVPTLRVGMQFWTLCVLFVALCVKHRFCDVSATVIKKRFIHRSHALRGSAALDAPRPILRRQRGADL
ncbi:hypothetical protein D5S10_02560 [Pseudomonas savastanoi]|nr:hypothetical protein PSYTB_02155 [Pseudomonas amygdali pv. tabaci str. ATCC 11528]QOI02863.1 hypothetical protein D5S10_02560 [Pseudomonas savastanoi]